MDTAKERWGTAELLSDNKTTEDWEPIDYNKPKLRDTKKKVSKKKRKAKRKNQRKSRKVA